MGYLFGLLAFLIFLLRDCKLHYEKDLKASVLIPFCVAALLTGTVMSAVNLLQRFLPERSPAITWTSCLLFVALLIYILCNQQRFYTSLSASKRLLPISLTVICLSTVTSLVASLQPLIPEHWHLFQPTYTITLTVVLIGALVGCGLLMHHLLTAVFAREEEQHKLVKDFSIDVSQSLDSADITAKLGTVIHQETSVDRVYVCLPEKNHFQSRHCTGTQGMLQFSINSDSPLISHLRQSGQSLIVSAFRKTPQFHLIDEAEKKLLSDLSIGCISALWDNDEIIGLVLLATGNHSCNFNSATLNFLETVNSIAAIAIKNSTLYEQMFCEARVDPLTGTYNYRYFVEQVEEQFELFGKKCLTLLYVDVDDFKLYNQLYGASEGDATLRRIGKVLNQYVGDAGSVFRTSGKVFAVLLPQMSTHHANILAQDIQDQIHSINLTSDRDHLTPISVSIGICSAPQCATTAKVLINNADLATHSAKQAGKDRIVTFRNRTAGLNSSRLVERTVSIVENLERDSSEYSTALPMISALTAAIDAKDHYTYAHSKNVARYAATLAVAIGLNEDEVRMIYTAGLLHDIGKISISEKILNKSGRLEGEEYTQMKGHVNNSIDMIRHLPEMDFLVPGVLGHHERWDGMGYPCGLSGENLPLAARLLAIADTFDAMTTNRSYRKSLPLEYALEEIQRCAGSQLDPELAPLFVKLIRERNIPVFSLTCA